MPQRVAIRVAGVHGSVFRATADSNTFRMCYLYQRGLSTFNYGGGKIMVIAHAYEDFFARCALNIEQSFV